MSHFLKPDVQIEPLVNHWSAHLLLVPPPTAARFLQSQLTILESYLRIPKAHARALEDPRNVGGPFIDLGGERVEEIGALEASTRRRCARLLALADALRELDGLLAAHGRALPLAPLYARLPEPLRGLVELVYDVRHRPDYRFFEPLVYADFGDTSLQSVALTRVVGDERAFIFSTPRLSAADVVHLPLRFDAPALDDLCRLRWESAPLDALVERFEIPEADRATFASFLSECPPPQTTAYAGRGVRMRHFGHACVLFESAGASVLIDPLISYRYPSPIERFTFEDLPPFIDYILITHAHHDHLVLETLLQLRSRTGTVIVPRSTRGALQDPSLGLALRHVGFSRVVELDEFETISLPDGCIQGIPFLGEHCDLAIRAKAAYLLRMADQTTIVLADCNSLSPEVYTRVRREVGKANRMLIGLEAKGAPMSWAYGPLLSERLDRSVDHQRRSNGADWASALRLAEIFECEQVFLYAMGQEPWLSYLMALHPEHQHQSAHEAQALAAACAQRGVAVETLHANQEFIFSNH